MKKRDPRHAQKPPTHRDKPEASRYEHPALPSRELHSAKNKKARAGKMDLRFRSPTRELCARLAIKARQSGEGLSTRKFWVR